MNKQDKKDMEYRQREFSRLYNLRNDNGIRYNNRGREVYPFAKLNWINICSYSDLLAEFVKINEKTSTFPKKQRISIVKAMVMCEPKQNLKNGKDI